MSPPHKYLFITVGWLFLLLAVLGIFLPLLPTTPFALLAAYFFSKGSARLHAWLLAQPAIGPLILQWQRFGVIKRKAKIYSTVMIVPLFAYTLIAVKVAIFVKCVVALIGICVLVFIWTRPSVPKVSVSNDPH